MLKRLRVLDWVRGGLLLVGLVCLVTGVLPWEAAESSLRRIAPLLVFLCAVIVLAELAKEARVFDVVAAALARAGRGRYPALFGVCFGFAAVCTVFLNLDTTAVLLTPVLLAMAGRAGIPGLPLAMTTVWLANTASLLLPVSNLTNLLAADRLELPPLEFAGRMWLPQVVILACTAVFLWVFYWRRHPPSYTLPEKVDIGDPVVFRVLAAACLAFALAVLGGVPIEVAAVVSAVVAVGVFAWRDRGRLSFGLIPWGLLVFVTGLFLVVGALEARGVLDGVAGGDPFAVAALGGGLGNVVNNLPAYVAVERGLPPEDTGVVLALLIGTNAGTIVTPWGSLATLLWFEQCRRFGLRVPVARFMATGLGLAVCCVGFGVLVLGR